MDRRETMTSYRSYHSANKDWGSKGITLCPIAFFMLQAKGWTIVQYLETIRNWISQHVEYINLGDGDAHLFTTISGDSHDRVTTDVSINDETRICIKDNHIYISETIIRSKAGVVRYYLINGHDHNMAVRCNIERPPESVMLNMPGKKFHEVVQWGALKVRPAIIKDAEFITGVGLELYGDRSDHITFNANINEDFDVIGYTSSDGIWA